MSKEERTSDDLDFAIIHSIKGLRILISINFLPVFVGQSVVGATNIQVIVGTSVQFVANEIDKLR